MAGSEAGGTPEAWLSLIGLGEDGLEGLSPAARGLLGAARLVVGGRRHLALAEPLIQGETLAWSSPLTATIPRLLERRGEPVAVLASGDPFLFGVGATLRRHLPAAEMRCLPQPSSIALAAARLGWAQQECALIALGGRPLASLRPLLQPGRRVLALSAGAETPGQVAQALVEWGFGPSRMALLEALGGPHERVRHTTAHDFALDEIQALNLVAVEVAAEPGARILPCAPGLPEAWFEHDGQITKREIRALTLASLRPRAGERLWDIGCGCGSVAVEWLLAEPSTQALAVERRSERAAAAARNAAALGVPRLEVRTGEAREALAEAPAPDAVFLGGGVHDPALIEACYAALTAGGRLVANSVTLESEQAIQAAWQRYGGTLTRLSVERAEPLGRLHAYRPAMPILQWAVEKGGP